MISIALTTGALLLLAPAQTLPAPSPAALTLTFDVGAGTGRIMVALFDSEAAYDGRGAPVAQSVVDVGAGERDAAFPDLKPGAYAAKIFHDVDGDGQMDTNPRLRTAALTVLVRLRSSRVQACRS